MAEGFRVDPERLNKLQAGLSGFQDQLKAAGDTYGSDVGTGVENLTLTGGEVGHAGLASAWKNFVETIDIVNRIGTMDLSKTVSDLGGTARLYQDTEDYASNLGKDVFADAFGNPHLTDDQVEKKSWGQVAGDNPITQLGDIGHGWSKDAAQHAADHIDSTWQNEWDDLKQTGVQRIEDSSGVQLPQPGQGGSDTPNTSGGEAQQ